MISGRASNCQGFKYNIIKMSNFVKDIFAAVWYPSVKTANSLSDRSRKANSLDSSIQLSTIHIEFV
jgi:hypothetical protein